MKISGFEKFSLVDYPGKMAAAIFTPGCQMKCFYCHNQRLNKGAQTECIEEGEVLAQLKRRRGFLEGVVVSGGEPTLQNDLERFLLDLRELGFPIKLDTNGLRPEVLRQLIDARLVDYIAMDLKATPADYDQMAGAPVDIDAVESSTDLLLEGRVDYEFRTTMAPEIDLADLRVMGNWIRGARLWVLQQYRPISVDFFGRADFQTPPARDPEEILRWAASLRGIVQEIRTRGMGGAQTIDSPPPKDFEEDALISA